MYKKVVSLLVIVSLLLLAACNAATETNSGASGKQSKKNESYTVKIANLSLAPLNVAHEKGWIEEEFAKIGATVEFSNHTSGPPINEGIASKRVDLAVMGEGAVLGGANNNLDIKLLSIISAGRKGTNNIIVPKGSSIKDVRDLKGKQIGVMSGTSHHVFLLKALEKAGLRQADIKIVNLSLADAQPAFQTGKLDAWVTSEPYVTMEVQQNDAVVITTGEKEKVTSPIFALARGEFAKEHPEAVETFLKILDRVNQYQKDNYDDYIDTATKISGTDRALTEILTKNAEFENSPISTEILEDLQHSADILKELDYLNKKVDVKPYVDSSFIEKIKES